MVIGVIGENCSGKSTLAAELQKAIGAEIITGKDYLRMAKSESEAERLFKAKLSNAVSGENIIYVISEKELIDLLPAAAIKILVKADIETVKERFKKRMHGNLPSAVERMLTIKHGAFDKESCDYEFDGVSGDYSEICDLIKNKYGLV